MSRHPDFVIENDILKMYRGSGGDVIIPEGVVSIGDRAFQLCSDLTSAVFPKSLRCMQLSGYCHDSIRRGEHRRSRF